MAGVRLARDRAIPLGRLHEEVLGLRLVGVGGGFIEMSWEPTPALVNGYGFVHGGYVAMALDDVAGMAALPALGEGMGMLTAGLDIQYLRPVVPDRYRLLGRAVRVGRTLILGDAEVVGHDGALYARVSGTFIPRPGPGTDGAPGPGSG